MPIAVPTAAPCFVAAVSAPMAMTLPAPEVGLVVAMLVSGARATVPVPVEALTPVPAMMPRRSMATRPAEDEVRLAFVV